MVSLIKNHKRRIIQLLSALIYNVNLKGFAKGSIFKGGGKGVCVPGLNCYSCPGAIASCPLGSLQMSLNEINYRFPFYITGTLLVFGALLGRAVCAFLCPFGLIQELIYKIPSPKIKKSAWTRRFSFLKHVILIVFVLYLPIFYLIKNGVAVPAFCKYICPAGTLEGGIPLVAMNKSLQMLIGTLFWRKTTILLVVILGSVVIFRPFCRFICPLGAIYSLFNRFALIGVVLDADKCSGCNACVTYCKSDVRRINDRECLRCGECRKACPNSAIAVSFNIFHKKDKRQNSNTL